MHHSDVVNIAQITLKSIKPRKYILNRRTRRFFYSQSCFLWLATAGLFYIRATPGAHQKPQSLSGVSLRDGQCDFLCGLVTP
ncbi:hypothetical protein, partial [Escherichia coli]|uniref:hypothetical protein n=1 Tax=Escherichia coli TaxID=562 RepID=UPI001FF16136